MTRTIIALLLTLPSTAYSQDITGVVTHIVDGDTFAMRVNDDFIRIRFCGIDAPEQGEPGYAESRNALQMLISGKSINCIQVGNGTPCDGRSKPTNGGRIVAQCFIDGRDIATMMIRDGYACDWIKFSGGHYRKEAGMAEACTVLD